MQELESNVPVVHEALMGGRLFREKMHKVSHWLNTSLKRLKIDGKKTQFRSEMKN